MDGEKLLKHYQVNTMYELRELLLQNDERVKDLREFLEFFIEQEKKEEE
ncbi:hypothetical protein IX329_001008 [Fusobacterium necrophorum]|nr:hypothetical protein [Fusobacterium necrophorum]MBR8733434.1 hypothetical protein [Fusobacterium necrophorum]MBR8789611.1 hypothetical protein [Fusobacterium necrophorum]